ncbi:DNA-processing protein DprA [Microbacterium pseudoresistens]|uniref:DNA processing protein n=1 Tax=Microbacterium pseudoresistens TaxID=640634 RepID=A0A7Y9JNM2_9MICO|nr:DNA-processing protein DprA [Microbacterium pseudoresistens]NYD55266.1 DNA processing protein [Microbacterium pseudoresistens]
MSGASEHSAPVAEVLGDAALGAAEALRPDRDPREVAARVAWNVITEPGDGVAGALTNALGPEDALDEVFGAGTRVRDASEGERRPAARALRGARARWSSRWDQKLVVSALHSAQTLGVRLLLPDDPDWPTPLDDLDAHAPQALWVRGDIGLLHGTAAAIVGARAATPYGEHVAGEMAGELAELGVCVVSGGAYGIDGAAHRAALRSDGGTVAFLAGGVDRAYPAGHAQLLGRIATSGAVLSEIPCGGAPTKWRFLARNRLIGAASGATVVVEAGARSGSLNTAGHAAALGRPLGAVPGPVTSAASAGCHRLLREYDARCVTSASDVRELLGVEEATMVGIPREDPAMIRLADALSPRSARSIDDLARRSGLAVERIGALLGILELDGGVTRAGAGWRRADA